MVFVGRQDEQSRLDRAFERAAAGAPQLVVVSGRRRVGKTFLLTHWLGRLPRDVRRVHHQATAQAEGVELDRFRTSIGAADRVPSWEAGLSALALEATERVIVAVIDEVPYLADSFPSVVQAVWDRITSDGVARRLMLVLTGSAVGIMRHMLGGSGALYGRATERITLAPLRLTEAAGVLTALSAEDVVRTYAVCGGYPLHLQAWDQSQSFDANLERFAFASGGLLVDDADAILRAELGLTVGGLNVLAAVGRGRARYSEIQSDAGQRIEKALDVLLDAGFVRRTSPVGAPRRATTLYDIPDPYLRFHFSVLYGFTAAIEGGGGAAVMARRRGEIDRQIGWTFEEAARDHAVVLAARGELGSDLLFGRWWAHAGGAVEIDVVGMRGDRAAVIGEASWADRAPGPADLARLYAKARRLPALVDDPVWCFWRRARADLGPSSRTYVPEDLFER